MAERALGSFERAMLATNGLAPLNIVATLELEPLPEVDAIRRSLRRLRQSYPVLGAHIETRGDKPWLVTEGTPEIPVRIEDSACWQTVAERELNTAFALEGPLLRLTLLPGAGGGRGWLVVSALHVLYDGTGLWAVLRDLLTGHEPSTAFEIGPPLEQRFPARFRGLGGTVRLFGFLARQLFDELGYRRAGGAESAVTEDPVTRCQVLPHRSDTVNIKDLTRAARARRVTLHALMHAAMVKATDRVLLGCGGGAIRGIGFSDLRPYLVPPVPPRGSGCHIAMMRYTVPTDDDVWSLARAIGDTLYRSAKRGDKFLSVLMAERLMKMLIGARNRRMATIALSLMDTPRLPEDAPITLHDLHAFVSANVLAPPWTALARPDADGIQWDYLYMDSDMDRGTAEMLVCEIDRTLEDAVSSGSEVS